MGKSFRRRNEDYDENFEHRKEKFRRRRNDKISKKISHDKALKPIVKEENEEEEQNAHLHICV